MQQVPHMFDECGLLHFCSITHVIGCTPNRLVARAGNRFQTGPIGNEFDALSDRAQKINKHSHGDHYPLMPRVFVAHVFAGHTPGARRDADGIRRLIIGISLDVAGIVSDKRENPDPGRI